MEGASASIRLPKIVKSLKSTTAYANICIWMTVGFGRNSSTGERQRLAVVCTMIMYINLKTSQEHSLLYPLSTMFSIFHFDGKSFVSAALLLQKGLNFSNSSVEFTTGSFRALPCISTTIATDAVL